MFIFFLSHLISLFDTNKSGGYNSTELECIFKYCSCAPVLCIWGSEEF